MKRRRRVIVGLSGGVDSAVSAYLLQQQGFEVWAVFMKNWEGEEGCSAAGDVRDATLVAHQLGIPLYTFNFSNDYWQHVFAHFLAEYRAGRTPNPDILCNSEIKFRAFLEKCLELDADYMACGHYARTRPEDGALLKGVDPGKDQSYFLYAVRREALQRTLFPVGHLHKSEVRALAKEIGLPNATRKDSVGICFIEPGRFRPFLQSYLGAQPGDVVSWEGQTIGRHTGLMYHTIGQRKGLGIGGPGEAWYVCGKDLENRRLIVCQGASHPALFAPGLIFAREHSLLDRPIPEGRCQAKIRYRQKDQLCTVKRMADGLLLAIFDQAQRAISPGQAIVMYQGEQCLGGGTIERAVDAKELAG
jgi:tRNA-specific 2-thiouridylase